MPPKLTVDVQRERLLFATLAAAARFGYRGFTVDDVIARAGATHSAFYRNFACKEECFLAALDTAARRLRDRLEGAARDGGDDWRGKVRSGLESLLGFLAEEPDAARALIVEARASSPAGLRRRDELLDSFAACVDATAREGLDAPPSAIAAAGVVGGIDAVLYARLRREEVEGVEALLPALMYSAVLPYEGHDAAAEELGDAALV